MEGGREVRARTVACEGDDYDCEEELEAADDEEDCVEHAHGGWPIGMCLGD